MCNQLQRGKYLDIKHAGEGCQVGNQASLCISHSLRLRLSLDNLFIIIKCAASYSEEETTEIISMLEKDAEAEIKPL